MTVVCAGVVPERIDKHVGSAYEYSTLVPVRPGPCCCLLVLVPEQRDFASPPLQLQLLLPSFAHRCLMSSATDKENTPNARKLLVADAVRTKRTSAACGPTPRADLLCHSHAVLHAPPSPFHPRPDVRSQVRAE